MTTFLLYIMKTLVVLLLFRITGADYKDLNIKEAKHQLLETPTHRLSLITKGDTEHLKRTAEKILIPRVVGTANHDKVRDFIINSMENLQWRIERDVFEDDTPNMGRLTFENIVATLNPDADRFLVLACHYDSKYFPGEDFVGATDSAIPCAMLINLAHVLNDYLKSTVNKDHPSIKLIFFDGEEAFENWSELDSIYGAKHLAKKWERKGMLEKIDLLVLLDLIGMPDPTFYNYFKKTLKFYLHLMGIEERLAVNNYLERYTASSASKSLPNAYFQPRTSNAIIEDDHIPFLERGVPTVHLIPQPFPEVWHKMGDNPSVIDYNTVENINKILRVFVIEYLQIEV